MRSHRILLFLAAAVLLSGGCRFADDDVDRTTPAARADSGATRSRGDETRAVAQVQPTEGSDVSGVVSFTAQGDQVLVEVSLSGLTPGPHGLHIHESGDCSAADASSAGDHYDPMDSEHGGPRDDQRHLGDLGNVTADSQGRVETAFVDDRLVLSGEHSILGRAVIVHAQRDDLTSQPGGDAGARMACGVIIESNPGEDG